MSCSYARQDATCVTLLGGYLPSSWEAIVGTDAGYTQPWPST